MAAAPTTPTRHVVLVGASIGKNWHIEKINERVALPGYSFEYVGVNSFDKGALIQAIVGRKDRPDIVLIKECATYFPGDEESYKRQLISWIGMLRTSGIQPMLVTTAPVAEPSGLMPRAKNVVKRLIGKPTWLDGFTQFNDWLTLYARSEHIPVFDLEALLRRNDRERWLRSEYDVGDGLHLNQEAYRVLDSAFAKFLVAWGKGTS